MTWDINLKDPLIFVAIPPRPIFSFDLGMFYLANPRFGFFKRYCVSRFQLPIKINREGIKCGSIEGMRFSTTRVFTVF